MFNRRTVLVRTMLALGFVTIGLALGLPRLMAQQIQPEPLRRIVVAHDRAVPRRPRQRRQRRARPAEHVLLRLGRRRTLEVDQRRPHLDADLRRAARRVDRRHRRRSLQPDTSSTSAPARADMRVADLATATGCTSRPTPAQTWTHIGLDDTRQIGARRRRPEEPRRRVRRGARPRLRRQPRPRRLPIARRRRDLAEGALQERQRRRLDLAVRPPGLEDRLRGAVEHAASAVVHLPAVERPRQRPLQVDRRRHDVAAADRRPAGRRARPHRRRRGAARSPRRVYAIVDAKEGGLYRSDDAGGDLDEESPATRASGAAAGTSARWPSIRRTPTSSMSRTRRSTDRRTAARVGRPIKGAPGGDDYHQLWIAPDDPTRMILGERPGRDRQRRRGARRGVPGTTSRPRSCTT